MSNVIMIIILAIMMVPLYLIFAFFPYLTKRTICMGVSIPEDRFSDERLKAIRNTYTVSLLVTGALVTGLAAAGLFLLPEALQGYVLGVVVILSMGSIFSTYVRAYKKTRALKQKEKWTAGRTELSVTETGFRRGKISVSPLWFILYGLAIACTLLIFFTVYDRLPDTIMLNYDSQGNPGTAVPKTPAVILFPLSVQLVITLLMVFVYVVSGRAGVRIDAGDPKASVTRNRIFRYAWSAYTVFMGLGMVILFGVMLFLPLLTRNITIMITVPLGYTIITVAGALILSLVLGQSGSRLKLKGKPAGKEINRDDDQYWKLGSFYFNPEDPALFVEKRFGIGYTGNFARPLTWVLMALLLLVIGGAAAASLTAFGL
jgi:uncharacterized membrane protein